MKKIILFIFILFSSSGAYAQSASLFQYSSTKLGFIYGEFAGEKNKSLGKNSTAYGMELTTKKSNNWLGIHSGFSLLSVGGEEYIMDATTQRTLQVSGYLFDLFLGPTISLIPSNSFPIKPYLGIYGIGEIVYLRLPSETTYTEISSNENKILGGYAIAIGVEYQPTSMLKSSAYNIEARARTIRGKLFNQDSFSLGGFQISIGFGF